MMNDHWLVLQLQSVTARQRQVKQRSSHEVKCQVTVDQPISEKPNTHNYILLFFLCILKVHDATF